VVGCRIIRNLLYLLTLRGLDVLPVPHGNGMGDDEGNVRHGILDTDAPMGTTSENEVVSRIGVSRTIRI